MSARRTQPGRVGEVGSEGEDAGRTQVPTSTAPGPQSPLSPAYPKASSQTLRLGGSFESSPREATEAQRG